MFVCLAACSTAAPRSGKSAESGPASRVGSLGSGGTPADFDGAGGAAANTPSLAFDDVPLDGIDSNGDGYDFPLAIDDAPGGDAPCQPAPRVTLPALVARTDCAGRADLVIGWVTDCVRCDHAITLVVGNRGAAAVDAVIIQSIQGNVEPGLALGVIPALTWSEPIQLASYFDPILTLTASDGGTTCDATEASVGPLTYIECLPK
jgi:hypothetical protein